MTLTYTSKLSLKARHTNVRAQKIDSSIFSIFGIVLASFQIENKFERARFFHKTFLLTDISIEVVLGMLFWTLSNVNIQFAKRKLTKSFYTIAKALPTIIRVELINKKKFAKAALDAKSKTFEIYVAKLQAPEITIYSSQTA